MSLSFFPHQWLLPPWKWRVVGQRHRCPTVPSPSAVVTLTSLHLTFVATDGVRLAMQRPQVSYSASRPGRRDDLQVCLCLTDRSVQSANEAVMSFARHAPTVPDCRDQRMRTGNVQHVALHFTTQMMLQPLD